MNADLEHQRANASAATDEELLDRFTVYRAGIEPSALAVIEEELARREIDDDEVRRHVERRGTVIIRDGIAQKCSYCARPAIKRGWGWHWLWGKIPVFPRPMWRCAEHDRPARSS